MAKCCARSCTYCRIRFPVQFWFLAHLCLDTNWIGFFILGCINNLAYVVINSAAQSLAISFDARNLVGLVPWANVAVGFLFRFVNMWMVGVAYKWRMLLCCLMFVIGLVGVAFSVYVNFVFALLMIVFVGAASSFGESILLTYQRNFPPEVVGGWSSGTGLAGVGGALLYILFSAVLKFSNEETFICLIPSVIIYMMAYGLMLHPEPPAVSAASPASSSPKKEHGSDVQVDAIDHDGSPLLLEGAPKEKRGARYWRCVKLVAWQAINLMLVYFFEYVASVGAADKSQPPGSVHSTDWFVRNAFVLLAFMYQAGVFVSRSSLRVVRIRRVEILTVIQAANFVLWILQAYYKFMPIGAQLPLMFFVGLLGGASYVNIFYNLLHDDIYPDEDRELIVNMAAVCINLGIVLAGQQTRFFIVVRFFSSLTFFQPVSHSSWTPHFWPDCKRVKQHVSIGCDQSLVKTRALSTNCKSYRVSSSVPPTSCATSSFCPIPISTTSCNRTRRVR